MNFNGISGFFSILFKSTKGVLNFFLNYFRSVFLAFFYLSGPPALPFLGNALILKNTNVLLEIGKKASDKYTRILRCWIFFLPIFLIYEPEDIQLILSHSNKISDKNFFYKILRTIIGDGLITSTGNNWKKNRKLIQPFFHLNILETYLIYFKIISQQIFHNNLDTKKPIQITKLINTCILNILHKTVLGVELTADEETPFRKGELFLIKRLLQPWLLIDSIFKLSKMSQNEQKQLSDLHCYVKKIFDQRILEKKFSFCKFTNQCVLDGLIDLYETGNLTETEIINETVTFMLAGQDSVGAAVAFSLFYLAKNPIIQQKVYDEILQVNDEINAMNYLTQCVKETLRLLPSVPLIARKLTNDIKIGNLTIPEGTNIVISPFVTHHLPHIFLEPEKFNPERFSKENLKNLHSFAFLPFSAGPRNCIGYKFAYMEIKSIISTILKNYKITLKNPQEELKLNYGVSFRAKGGIWINFSHRNRL